MTTVTFILDGIWGLNSRWNTLRKQVESIIGPAHLFPYDSSGRVPIETLAGRLVDHIERTSGPARVNLIGFSMGGIVCRTAAMLRPGLPLRRAVFINAPHRGSWLAYLLPLRGVRQLRPGSELLGRLVAAEADWNVPTLAIWCPLDMMVVPGTSSRWPPARRRVSYLLPVHPWPAWSRRLRGEVLRFLSDG